MVNGNGILGGRRNGGILSKPIAVQRPKFPEGEYAAAAPVPTPAPLDTIVSMPPAAAAGFVGLPTGRADARSRGWQGAMIPSTAAYAETAPEAKTPTQSWYDSLYGKTGWSVLESGRVTRSPSRENPRWIQQAADEALAQYSRNPTRENLDSILSQAKRQYSWRPSDVDPEQFTRDLEAFLLERGPSVVEPGVPVGSEAQQAISQTQAVGADPAMLTEMATGGTEDQLRTQLGNNAGGITGPIVSLTEDGYGYDAAGNRTDRAIPVDYWYLWPAQREALGFGTEADSWFNQLNTHDQEMIDEKLQELKDPDNRLPSGAIDGEFYNSIIADLMEPGVLSSWDTPNLKNNLYAYLGQYTATAPGVGGIPATSRATDMSIPWQELTPDEYQARMYYLQYGTTDPTPQQIAESEWTGLIEPLSPTPLTPPVPRSGEGEAKDPITGEPLTPSTGPPAPPAPPQDPPYKDSFGTTGKDLLGGPRTPFDPTDLPGITVIGTQNIAGQNVYIVQQADGSTGYYDQQPVYDTVQVYNEATGLMDTERQLVGYGPVTWYELTPRTPEFEGERNWANQLFQMGVVPDVLRNLGVSPENIPAPGTLPTFQPNRPFLQRISTSPALQNLLVDFYARQLGIPREAAANEISRIAGTLSPLDTPMPTGYGPIQQQVR